MRASVFLAALAFAAAGASAQTPSGELTHPRAHPQTGHRHSSFAVTFTLRHDAGHSGVTQTDYQVRIGAPHGTRPGCEPAAPQTVSRGRAGARVRVALIAPRGGWCLGRYRVTIWLQRGPYCPPPQPGGRPTPCPLFATREQATGTVHFTVRAASR